MKPVVIQPGDNDAILWYVEWTLQCWIAGLALAGISGTYEVKVVRSQELGKERLTADVRLNLPVSAQVVGRSRHLWEVNLYELYHSESNFTIALSEVLVATITRMATSINEKLNQIEDTQSDHYTQGEMN